MGLRSVAPVWPDRNYVHRVPTKGFLEPQFVVSLREPVDPRMRDDTSPT